MNPPGRPVRAPAPARPGRRWLPFGAAVLACLATFSGSGCDGGTSSGADNPDINIAFRLDGKPVAFRGLVQFFGSGINPVFFNPPADDGGPTTVDIVIEFGQPTTVKDQSSVTIPGKIVAKQVDSRPLLPLYSGSNPGGLAYPQVAPGGSGTDIHRPFNVVCTGFDSLEAMVEGVRVDSGGRFRDSAGNVLDTLWVDLKPKVAFSGTLDMDGIGDAPLAVFIPGSPFYSPVQGNRFYFPVVPRSPLPARLAMASGIIRSLPNTVARPASFPESTVITDSSLWKPGPRVDSIEVPVPLHTLEWPEATPAGEYRFTDSLRVALAAESGAMIRYTVDGSEPGTQSPAYTGPILLRSSATVKAVAFRRGSNRSPVCVNNYVLVPPKPSVSPGGGAFTDSLIVVLGTFAKNGSVVYTLDGSTPTPSSPKYSAPITIHSSVTVKAATSVPGLGLSDIVEKQYVRIPDSVYVVPEIPEASPAGGTFADSVEITLSSATAQAVLYFTLDGSTPTPESGVRYDGKPLRVTQNTILKVVAILAGVPSRVLEWSYSITASGSH